MENCINTFLVQNSQKTGALPCFGQEDVIHMSIVRDTVRTKGAAHESPFLCRLEPPMVGQPQGHTPFHNEIKYLHLSPKKSRRYFVRQKGGTDIDPSIFVH